MTKKTVEAECANCRYFRPVPVLIIGEARGQCAMPPPPIVAQLYSALNQEPNLQIAYEQLFNHQLPDALKNGACAAHKPETAQ